MLNELDITDESIAAMMPRGSNAIKQLPADMPRWMARTIVAIDRFSLWIGRMAGWLILPLIVAMVYEIIARYAFTAPTVWAYDISRMIYGALFILGAGYGLSRGAHIRSDFLYRGWSVHTQGKVDAFLYLVFFLPAMLVFFWVAADWAWAAIERGERGMDTAWMPPLGPIKACLPIGILFLILQGISELLKSVYAATHGQWPNE